MKKIAFVLSGLIVAAAINAQSLEEIVKKYSEANKYDKISSVSTLKITGKMSMAGMEMPLSMWMKSPNKIKSVTTITGQDMISVFDGVKGYTVSPLTGSAEPVEMTADQVRQVQNNNVLQNYMANYLKEGKLTLIGTENVKDKPAFKIKANIDGTNSADIFIDKTSYLIVKTSTKTSSGGMDITLDAYPTDYKETNGVLLPMKTTSSAQGMDILLVFEKVEVNIPIEDSVFKIK